MIRDSSPMASVVWKDKVCVVTGASSGLGEEFARQIARKGGKLVLVARSEGKLRTLARELEELSGHQALVVPLDLSRSESASVLQSVLEENEISVEHLVNNAGVGRAKAVSGDDPQVLADMVSLNCVALTELTARLLPQMVQRGTGGVIQVASILAFTPTPYMSAYAATKAFVKSFSEGLAEELRATGVRTLAVCPGQVHTGFQAAAGFSENMSSAPGLLSSVGTVRRALLAYERGKTVAVTGMMNRLITVVLSVLPNALSVPLTGRMMKKTGRFD